MFTRRLVQVMAAGVFTAVTSGLAQAQDAFERAKTLYLEAAYEDALALLDTRGPGGTAELHLYRALCLLALGRTSEADAAIAKTIEADPLATVARRDVSPSVAAMLDSARRRMVPEIARRRVADGRLLYQKGDRAGATLRFEAAIRLLDDPMLANQSELADLKALASGFLDLIRAQSVQPAAPTPAAPARAAATPAPVTPPAAPAPSPAVSRPTVVSQTLPPWRPPDPSWRNRELRGSVLLSIDAAGRVTSATMQQSVYPGYDRLLLDAARTWRYTPAMRAGLPTPSQLIVPIVIRPSE